MNKTDAKISVLLIEDNPADSRLVSIFLKSIYGDRAFISIADSLSIGLEMAEQNKPDVIILDLSLPDSGGLETFTKLHTKISYIPVIVLTGLEDETVGIDAVKMGAQDFLQKGEIDERILKKSISHSIERQKLLRELAENTYALYAEKQKLSEAQALAHIGNWEWDMVTKEIIWSDEFYRIHGMKPGEDKLFSDTMTSFIHPEDQDYVQNAIGNVINTAKQVNFTYRIIRKDGAVRTLFSTGDAVLDNDGKTIKLIGTGQDITDRVHEEEMEKLAVAATQSINSVAIIDENGTVEWVNEGFTAITGYVLDEVKNKNMEALKDRSKTKATEDYTYYKKVIKEKKPVTYESKSHSKAGKEYWIITTLTPVLDNEYNVKRIIAIDTDITLRKQMEEDLRKATQVAEYSLQIKAQFLANMSHEIRTPMNAIVGFTGLILKTPLSEEQTKYLNAIKTSGENLLVIINDILDFSKIQSGKIHFEQTNFSITKSISSVIELLLPKCLEKNIKLIYTIERDIPEYVIGDPTRLNQVLNNLVGNAIKFTKKGEVKILAELVKKDGQNVEIKFTVSDTGIGIPEEKIHSIFDYFTQASPETTRKYGGTGLGLAIVKQLVEQQGGTLKVESKLNSGTVFAFNLSFPVGIGEEETTEQECISVCDMNSEELTILLVEDNELNSILAEKILTDWDWKVDVAEDAFIALDKIKQKKYDVVLMDIQLPGMDGYEATHRIRNDMPPDKRNIPIIAMTAHALSSEEEKCLKSGMNGYISKPFEPENLYGKIIATLKIKNNYPVIPRNTNSNSEKAKLLRHSNLTYLRGIANSNNDFVVQMLKIFIDQTPPALERLEKAINRKDWTSVRAIAHKIKPSVTFIGLKEIEKDVPALENYAEAKSNLNLVPSLYKKINKVCTEAVVELEEEIEKLK